MDKYQAVLFDLDGTLIDSAPDLIKTLNDLLIKYQRPTLAESALRQFVSYGSTKLLEIGFNHDFPQQNFQALRNEFLALYKTQNTILTTYFSGVEALLDKIEGHGIPWGIITNKPTDCTLEIIEKLGMAKRTNAIVCGDTLPVAKPDPSPLYLACKMLNVEAKNCVYVGDCIRDIEAGRNAGMQTIACEYGYIDDLKPHDWQANFIAKTPLEIASFL